MTLKREMVVALGILALLCGCGKDESSKRQAVTLYKSLQPDDIIVQVNDNILRKREMERFWAMNLRAIKNVKSSEVNATQMKMQRDMMEYAPKFVEQMLLVDDAKRHKVLTETQVVERVEAMIDAAAKSKKMSREAFVNQFGDSAWFVRRTAEIRTWINAHVSTNIPPIVDVTPEVASNYLALINSETGVVRATNEWKKATLAKIRKDVMAGKVCFTNEAARLSEDEWNLGDLERTEVDFGSEIRQQIFSVPGGIILEPMEDEECYRLIQVAKVIPGTKDEKGRLLDREKRRIYQIVLNKEDYPLQMTYPQAYRDIYHQFQMQAVQARIELLKTNGQNKVVWPHGTNLWSVIKK